MPPPCHLMLVLSPTLILTPYRIMFRASKEGSRQFYHHAEGPYYGLIQVERAY